MGGTSNSQTYALLRRIAARREQQLGKIDEISAQLAELALDEAHGWQLSVGPLRVRGRLTADRIALATLLFCGATLVAGSILVLTGVSTELGIALVVGATFAFGSCMVQFWSVAAAREAAVYSELRGTRLFERLRSDLEGERAELSEEIVQLKREASDARRRDRVV